MTDETKKDDGGQVYPSEWKRNALDQAVIYSKGITRRDWLAGMAMPALVQSGHFDGVDTYFTCPKCGWRSLCVLEGHCVRCEQKVDAKVYKEGTSTHGPADYIQKLAYILADAMIAEGRK